MKTKRPARLLRQLRPVFAGLVLCLATEAGAENSSPPADAPLESTAVTSDSRTARAHSTDGYDYRVTGDPATELNQVERSDSNLPNEPTGPCPGVLEVPSSPDTCRWTVADDFLDSACDELVDDVQCTMSRPFGDGLQMVERSIYCHDPSAPDDRSKYTTLVVPRDLAAPHVDVSRREVTFDFDPDDDVGWTSVADLFELTWDDNCTPTRAVQWGVVSIESDDPAESFREEPGAYKSSGLWATWHDVTFLLDRPRTYSIVVGFLDAYGNSTQETVSLRINESGWSRMPLTDTPPPRAYHAWAHDTERGRLVLFGGSSQRDGILGDTWEWDGATWEHIDVPGPPARSNHTMAYDNRRETVVLFGGSNNGHYFGDTWEWDGNEWNLAANSGPRPRYGAQMAYDDARGIINLFGGTLSSVSENNEHWQWDGNEWTPLSPPTDPGGRWEHRLVYDACREVTVMFGGTRALSRGGVRNDTWEWNGVDWSLSDPGGPGNRPSPRVYFGFAFDEPRCQTMLTGGTNVWNDVGDTWSWNGESWTLIEENSAFGARHAPTLAALLHDSHLVLFGGRQRVEGVWEDLRDQWTFSLTIAEPNPPTAEICDGLDNDRDGEIDEGDVGQDQPCRANGIGECANGTTVCMGPGDIQGVPNEPTHEGCDGLDNDCDGEIDEGDLGQGQSCDTGEPGLCRSGTTRCMGRDGLACFGLCHNPREICGDGLDNDFDGLVDNRCNGCPDGIAVPLGWVCVPGGTFEMGSDVHPTELPRHAVTLPPFLMLRTEVTNAEYLACVTAGACDQPSWDDGQCTVRSGDIWRRGQLPAEFRGPQQPVVCVDRAQAHQYADWAGARLPTEAEWEYAARSAGQQQMYPWGADDPDCGRAVHAGPDGRDYGCGESRTWNVCSHSPGGDTAQGLCDMSGNVWEWVEDCFQTDYAGAPVDGTARTECNEPARAVFRGGSWYNTPYPLRAACRAAFPGNTVHDRNDGMGFRVVSAVRYQAEICGDGVDNDHDGLVDNRCDGCLANTIVPAGHGCVAGGQVAGLVARWPFDDDVGVETRDVVGERHASVHNGEWTNGRWGNAIRFDGQQCGYAAADMSEPLDFGTRPFSVVLWLAVDSDITIRGGESRVLQSRGDALAVAVRDSDTNLYGDGRPYVAQFQVSLAAEPPEIDIRDGRFHQIVFVRDGDMGRLYIDGEPNTSSPGYGQSHTELAERLFFGEPPERDTTRCGDYKGLIDDVSLWTRALTDEEVADLYEYGPGAVMRTE